MAVTRHFNLSKPKPSTSEWLVEIDLTSWLGTEEIDSVVYTAINKSDGSDATAVVLDQANCTNTTTKIYPFVQGGVDKATYVVTCVVTTDGVPPSIESFYLEFDINDDIPGVADLSLDVTIGGVDSTSYCTLTEAETYHRQHLHTENWDGASNDDKMAALLWSRRLLDEQMIWAGSITTTTQALSWPRSGVYTPDNISILSTEIPNFLKNAQAEYAAWLIASDRTSEPGTMGFKEIGLGRGEIKLVIDKYDQKPLMPSIVWQMIKFYGRKSTSQARFLIKV